MRPEIVQLLLEHVNPTPDSRIPAYVARATDQDKFVSYLKKMLNSLPELNSESRDDYYLKPIGVNYYEQFFHPLHDGKIEPFYASYIDNNYHWTNEFKPVGLIEHSKFTSGGTLSDDYMATREERVKRGEYGLVDYLRELEANEPLVLALRNSPIGLSVLFTQSVSQLDMLMHEKFFGPFLLATGVDRKLIDYWQRRNTYKKINTMRDKDLGKEDEFELRFCDFLL